MNATAAYTYRICHRHFFSRLDGPSFQIHEARTCILPEAAGSLFHEPFQPPLKGHRVACAVTEHVGFAESLRRPAEGIILRKHRSRFCFSLRVCAAQTIDPMQWQVSPSMS
jgi:hypothetical protein